MSPAKRRGGGRTTPKKSAGSPPTGDATSCTAAVRATPLREEAKHATPHSANRPAPPAPSSRYSPPKHDLRLRPRWHRLLGWCGVALGALVIIVNDLMLVDAGVRLLPFGHSELYLFAGLAAAACSTWFLGLFDRGRTVFE